MFHANELTMVYVDGPSLYYAAKRLHFIVDFKRFRNYFQERTHLLRMAYYTPVHEGYGDDPAHIQLQPLLDWLSFNGYDVITKFTKPKYDATGNCVSKGGNMNVEIACDALMLAQRGIQHFILTVGDGDMLPLVLTLQQLGKRVTVVSHYKGETGTLSSTPVLAEDLRRQADAVIDVLDIKEAICREN